MRMCLIGEENEGPITENGHALFHTSYKYTSSYLVRVEKPSGDSKGQNVYVNDTGNIENSPRKHTPQWKQIHASSWSVSLACPSALS